MIVCHCRALSDRAIRAAIQDGEDEEEALTMRCGAGGKCGGCLPALRRLIAEHRVDGMGSEQRKLAPA
jgi:bacterioferritin-associated ferredoxin